MPRPSTPLINRAAVIEASLAIIDAEGLDALSLPRIAKQIGVRAPSLYHHFSDKSEILSSVAQHIAGADVARPRRNPGPDWPEYFVALGLNFRRAVLRHRGAAPLLLTYLPRNVLTGSYEDVAQFLLDSGVPIELHVQILDGMETLAIGATIMEAVRKQSTKTTIFPNVDKTSQPLLAAALAANEYGSKQLYEEMIRSFLHGIMRDHNIEIAAPNAVGA